MPSPTRDTSDRVLYRGDTWVEPWTHLGNITGYKKLWFTAREERDDPDSQSAIQIVLSNPPDAGDGLLYIAGGSASVAANGSITVSSVPYGDITVTLEADESAKLGGSSYDRMAYDIQWQDASDKIYTLIRGMLNAIWDVTRATS